MRRSCNNFLVLFQKEDVLNTLLKFSSHIQEIQQAETIGGKLVNDYASIKTCRLSSKIVYNSLLVLCKLNITLYPYSTRHRICPRPNIRNKRVSEIPHSILRFERDYVILNKLLVFMKNIQAFLDYICTVY